MEEKLRELIAIAEELQQLQISPYPLLKIPEYQERRHGQWVLERQDGILMRGYFTFLQSASPNYVLRKGETVWMSLTPMELESQAHHAIAACGHTVIMGLGMGLLLYNVIQKDSVRQVTVVERDPEIVELLYQIANPKSWTGWDKVKIVIADALNWKPDEPVDFLSVDIWSKLGDMNLRSDGQRIQNHVQSQQVALWGQELDFISFLSEEGYEPPPTLKQYQEYIKTIEIPLIESQNPNYPGYCLQATSQAMEYN
ncbi:hypothetical protein PCC9214_05400 (plasmid) [Planktothrix tepida]|uniref:Spermidine synthase n=1 Tax=Planktothrix tepida PCC 9214 TaxID=671072 RepID=A0A1J1LN34_9CYAN|nr:hypothetical protein [Planktothrix tepida]CAD5988519.1 hypothetical protein PCC9214_05400 [Planktothrix tepida]CUR33899.1 conserved hypothetical protein [Planktothrix tepida PCC 9214]